MIAANRSGVAVAAAALLLTAGGVALDLREYVAFGMAGVAALAAAMACVLTVSTPVGGRRFRPDRVVEGRPVHVRLAMTAVAPPWVGSMRLSDTIVGHRVQVPVRSEGTGVLTYELPACPRGVYTVAGPVVEFHDPLGLLRSQRRVGEPRRLYVRPRVDRLVALAPQRHAVAAAGSPLRNDDDGDFVGLRDYVVGDDLRFVHWAAVARTGKLIVRQHSTLHRATVVVLLDTTASHYGTDEFDAAVRVAATASVSAIRSRRPVDVRRVSPGGCTALVAGLTGHGGEEAVLDALAAAQPAVHSVAAVDWPAALHTGAGGRPVAITGGGCPDAERIAVRAFQAGGVLVQIDTASAAAGSHGPGLLRIRASEEFAAAWAGRMR